MFSIATWNINSIRVRLDHVLEWLSQQPVDVLALQETKSPDDVFPKEAFEAAGYHVCFSGQRTYNGVALISRTPIEKNVVTDFPDFDDPARRILGANIHGCHILNLYVPNGAAVDSDKYQYKLGWLNGLQSYLEECRKQYENIIILGDFNIAPTDEDVHDPKRWEGNVLVSPKERDAFQQILSLGFSDTYRLFEPSEVIYSWWDYRGGAFPRNHGLRIDHILASDALKSRCKSCTIDSTPRAWERPSDHTPVIATFDLAK
ncbi:MAG: exodeoxyribonuclease III [Gammaproteobacteria bacterium]